MTTWAYIHTKGGSQKTTSAIYTTESLTTRHNIKTHLYDADPQKSTLLWYLRATQTPNPPTWKAEEISAKQILKLKSNPTTINIIDTPPGHPDIIQACINTANIIIIPCGCSPADIDRIWPTLDACTGHPTVVLLTKVDLRTNLYHQVKQTLHDNNVPLLDSVISQKETYKKAYGNVPTNLTQYNNVTSELLELQKALQKATKT